METLDLLANNLANASAPGFKADREFYGLYESANIPSGATSTELPEVQRQWTDFSQGSLATTANALDLAISGRGFFVVKGPSGPLYTRDGSLKLSPQGELETQEGYPLQDVNGNPIQLDSSKAIDIGADGTITQDGVEVSQMKLVDFSDPQVLSKRGQSYFFSSSGEAALPAANAQIDQGKLENANLQTAESAVRLVTVMRQFESLQKAMNIGNDMNKKALEEVARVTS